MRDNPYRQHTAVSRHAIVVVGTSLGGLHALQVFLSNLPENFPLPVAIVQHRHKQSSEILSAVLQQYCALSVADAEDKEAIAPGRVYLAPPDYHLLVEAGKAKGESNNGRRSSTPTLALSTEAPVCYARPSINVLFESAAVTYGDRVIGVILTGASHDGAQGLAKIKAHGGLAVVQEPSTAESPVMPKAAISALYQQCKAANVPDTRDWIMPLHDIAPFIVNLCHPVLR